MEMRSPKKKKKNEEIIEDNDELQMKTNHRG